MSPCRDQKTWAMSCVWAWYVQAAAGGRRQIVRRDRHYERDMNSSTITASTLTKPTIDIAMSNFSIIRIAWISNPILLRPLAFGQFSFPWSPNTFKVYGAPFQIVWAVSLFQPTLQNLVLSLPVPSTRWREKLPSIWCVLPCWDRDIVSAHRLPNFNLSMFFWLPIANIESNCFDSITVVQPFYYAHFSDGTKNLTTNQKVQWKTFWPLHFTLNCIDYW